MEAKVSMEELSSFSHTVRIRDYLRAHDGKPWRCAKMCTDGSRGI